MTENELKKAAIKRHIVTDPNFNSEPHTCKECNTVYKSVIFATHCANYDVEIAAGN